MYKEYASTPSRVKLLTPLNIRDGRASKLACQDKGGHPEFRAGQSKRRQLMRCRETVLDKTFISFTVYRSRL